MKRKITALAVSFIMAVLLFCTFAVPASAAKTSIAKAVISYTETYTYTGKEIKPAVTVKYKGKTVSSKNYSVSYKNNKKVGVGTITVTGKGSYTGTVSKRFKIAPKKVTSLKAEYGDDNIKLTWKKSTGATGYYVYRLSGKSWKKIATVSATSYTDKKLSPSTEYKYKIKAYYKKSSTTITGDTVQLNTATAPTNPSGIKAITKKTSVALSWKSVTDAKGYIVYLYKDGKWSKLTTTSGTEFTVSDLSAGKVYRFAVRSYWSCSGKNYYSEYADIYCATLPKKPSSVSTAYVGHDSVTVKWSKVSGATGYKVYYSKCDKDGNPGDYERFAIIKSASTVSTTVTGLEYGTTYSFSVQAYLADSKCETVNSPLAYSENVTTTYPGVQDLYFADYTNTSITLGWESLSNVASYNIYIQKESGKELVTSVSGESTSCKITDLEENSSYTFFVVTEFKTSKGIVYGPEEKINVVTDDSKVDGVTLLNKKTTLAIGKTHQLKAEVTPSYAANTKLIYVSSKPEIASISSKGLITAHKKGTAIITVKSAEDESIQVSFTLRVDTVKPTKLTLPKNIILFVGEEGQSVDPATIVPTFTPADTTNKGCKVYYKDYTYSYKSLFSTKTETLKFSDYITFSDGKFIAKKATVEPNGDKRVFAFDVTFASTEDSTKTVTTKIQVVSKAPTITITGNEDDWYCGNTSSLEAGLDSYVSFTEKDLIWESSNPGIATVDENGNVTCKGVGTATITAYSPWRSLKATYNLSVRSYLKIEKNYFEGCVPGGQYQIEAQSIPAGTDKKVFYQSVDSDIATVNEDGLVTFHKEGTVVISVNIYHEDRVGDYFKVWFTSETYKPLEGSTSDLFYTFKSKANSVKNSASSLRGYKRTEGATNTGLEISSLRSEGSYADMIDFKSDFIEPTINTLSKKKETTVKNLPLNDPTYPESYATYISKIPVASNPKTILDGLTPDDIKTLELIDDGSYCYSMKITLKPESFSTLPTIAEDTKHGQVFDILTRDYVNNLVNGTETSTEAGSIKMSYKGYKTVYHDSSVILNINKATNQVESIEYDMSVDSQITDLCLDATVLAVFKIKHTANVSFTTRNTVKIEFFGN